MGPREATHSPIDNKARGINSEDKAATSAALRVPVEQAVLAVSAKEVEEVSPIAGVSELATAETSVVAAVLEIAAASAVATVLATAV